MKPIIAIVGRPNVGKSTLFNRISGRRAAIVEDVPGVTRDRHYSEAEWTGRSFVLIDTGGFEPEAEDQVRAGMARQARMAVEEATATVLVVDAMAGITSGDEEVASLLRRSGKTVVVAANKIDSLSREQETSLVGEVHALGLPVFPISAEHGRGVGDLLDAVLEGLEPVAPPQEEDRGQVCKLAVIGRPNVGKSTLVNRLIGEERMLAADLPGTTRDSVDAAMRYQGRTFVLTDTAGIRKKASISLNVERYSVVRALRSVEAADVVALLLEAGEPAVGQDERLAHMVMERGRPLMLVVNKWDAVESEGAAGEKLRATVRERLPEVDHAPVLLVSAIEGKRVYSVLEEAARLYDRAAIRVPTPDINRWLQEVVERTSPPLHRGKPVRLLYAVQVGARPPHFSITASNPAGVGEAYRRYLENRLRETFGFSGVPIRLSFKGRRRSRS
ncbi:MAG: ribosome biogenesis GTPase Der [Myxococcota bacterium]